MSKINIKTKITPFTRHCPKSPDRYKEDFFVSHMFISITAFIVNL